MASLGAFSLLGAGREGALYLDAVAHAQRHPASHPSIVNGSVTAAVRGDFGNVRFTERTKDSELSVRSSAPRCPSASAEGVPALNLPMARTDRVLPCADGRQHT